MHRIAMWSGPRNISTALMRAFENRTDTCVIDEPLYACYLMRAGFNHPGRDEILASYSTDYQQITRFLTDDAPSPCEVFYQKHMAHHLAAGDNLQWLLALTNVFLVREPQAMLRSLANVLSEVTLEDTGLPQQIRILQFLQQHDRDIIVLDSRKILEDPERMLTLLCQRTGLTPDSHMLQWPEGPRDSDGIWARYWYKAVNRSTGFSPYQHNEQSLPAKMEQLLGQCNTYYRNLLSYELT